MTHSAGDLPNVILIVVISFIILLLGVAVTNPIAEQTSAVDTSDTVKLNDAGEWTTISDTVGTEPTVYNSRGYAVALSGASDSYVQSTEAVDITANDTWTISNYASVNQTAASDTRVALSLDGTLAVTYNGTAGEWRAWYYDSGSRDSYTLAVPAPNQPGALTNLQVVANSTHLSLYRDNDAQDAVAIGSESVSAAPTDAANWRGRLDETRTFTAALNASQRQRLVDAPVGPHRTGDRALRAMYDEPERATQRAFWSTASIQTSNVSYRAGLPGEEMDQASGWNNLTGRSDYVWQPDGPRIAAVTGGALDEAPVAYVDWTSQGATGTFARQFTSALQFAGLAVLVAVLVAIVTILQATSGRR